MDARELHQTIKRLVEADHEQRAVPTRLREFEESNTPPLVPDRFDSLQDFVEFFRQQQNYDETKRRLQTERVDAKAQFDQARYELSKYLPRHVPLNYTYDGGHEELKGQQFTIVNMAQPGQGQISISAG
jgi:hypothetical protein